MNYWHKWFAQCMYEVGQVIEQSELSSKEEKSDARLHLGFFRRGSHTGLICRPQSRFEVLLVGELPGPSSSNSAAQ